MIKKKTTFECVRVPTHRIPYVGVWHMFGGISDLALRRIFSPE
jgi:hypothetical protein